MPGVLHSSIQCGFSREIGKMAFLVHPDLMILNDNGDPDCLFEASQLLLESADSDCDLPDNEHPVDLIKYLDSPNADLEHSLLHSKCCDGCISCSSKYSRCVSTRQDPFMGMWSTGYFEVSTAGPSTSASTLAQLANPAVDYYYGSEEVVQQQEIQDIKPFIAWNTPKSDDELQDIKPFIAWNTPKSDDELQDIKPFSAWNTLKSDDEPDFMPTKSLMFAQFDDDTSDLTFPVTPSPSAPSATNTGDDSDVDIETITDAPRSADSCGYITQDSSPENSPSSSPTTLRKFHNIGLSSKSSTNQNMLRVTSSTSLAVTLTNRSSFLGQKRKPSKDRKHTSKSQSHTVYNHVLCNSSSVNFHDYAMSPGACHYPTSTETGRPTVLSKRLYKRHSVDNPGKEKQHHHNQLERNRRQKLADLFVDLRDEVPKIASQSKASKVLILKEATLYIRDLQKWDKQQEDDISRELRKKELLKTKLLHLQAQTSRHYVK